MPAESRQRILIIDDDPGVRLMIQAAADPSYHVAESDSGATGLRTFFALRPNLVVLDIGLPDLSGADVLQRIRDLADTPVIMLTAEDDEQQIVNSLRLGADEYVTKPFSPVVLWARIAAILRRAAPGSPDGEARMAFDHGNLVLDRAARRVWVRGQEVRLTPIELRLLTLLALHPNQVLSAEQIVHDVWGPEYVAESGYVATYMRSLRSKIEEDPARPSYLVTRRGLWYMFLDDGKTS